MQLPNWTKAQSITLSRSNNWSYTLSQDSFVSADMALIDKTSGSANQKTYYLNINDVQMPFTNTHWELYASSGTTFSFKGISSHCTNTTTMAVVPLLPSQ